MSTKSCKLELHPDRKVLGANIKADNWPKELSLDMNEFFMLATLNRKACIQVQYMLLTDVQKQMRELFGPCHFTFNGKYARTPGWLLKYGDLEFMVTSAATRGARYTAITTAAPGPRPRQAKFDAARALVALVEQLAQTPSGAAHFDLLKKQLELPADLAFAALVAATRASIEDASRQS